MRRYLKPLGDELLTDNLGSIVARKRGTADTPRILILGHMDEVGFLVSQITDKGYLRFQTLGGWWEQVMLAQRVAVQTRKGEIIGIVGSKPPHILPQDERKKPVEKKDMFIDIGARSREEAEAFGVRPGDAVVPICPYTPLANPDMLLAKAWDNRAGCAIAIRTLEALQGEAHPNTVFAGATVQEEVGLRGAQTIANKVQPHVGIILDVAIAGDTPGVKPEEAAAELGKGPVLLLYDASMVPHVGLRNFVIDTAEAAGIPLQFQVLPGGGTDAGRVHLTGAGAPSVALGVATRYIHSAGSIVHRKDLDDLTRLTVELVKRLDAPTLEKLLAD
ncbi:MAG: M42 family metallopeptidase [Firmicutes bacterium]|nr:M42 family metallopeptidase [Bacillota bacterium]